MKPFSWHRLVASPRFLLSLSLLGTQDVVDDLLNEITSEIAEAPESPKFPLVVLPDLRMAQTTLGQNETAIHLAIFFRLLGPGEVTLEWACIDAAHSDIPADQKTLFLAA